MFTINLIDYAQFAVSILGSTANMWMLFLVLGDLRWIKSQGINGRAMLMLKARMWQEGLRLLAQGILLLAAIVTVSTRQITIREVDDLAKLEFVIVWRSAAMMVVSIILAVKSVMARMNREAIENYVDADGNSNGLTQPAPAPEQPR